MWNCTKDKPSWRWAHNKKLQTTLGNEAPCGRINRQKLGVLASTKLQIIEHSERDYKMCMFKIFKDVKGQNGILKKK